MPRYCLIGAGAAGIGALAVLLEQGFEVDCFEKSTVVGGHWHTDYEALHLITSRNLTNYEGFPMPDDYPLFPSRDQMRSYLESYAAWKGLYEHIEFGVEVLSVAPVAGEGTTGSHGWTVITSRGDEGVYDGVLVANGHLVDPKMPEIPGHFAGTQLHSSQYTNVDDIEGRRVLVVGSGNSGCDLAVDAAQHRYDVAISVRHGHIFQPKTFMGVPRSELSFLQEFTFEEQDLLTRLLIRMSVGTHENYPGLPAPEARTLAEGAPVVNNLLLYWMHHGRIKPVPGVSRFEGNTVFFTDGSSQEFDTILWATGFNAALPFLDDAILEWQDGVPLRLGGATVPVGLEKLYFVGLIAPRGPQPPVYPMQTKVIAQMLRAHEAAGESGAGIQALLAGQQTPEWRIDILRPLWTEQLEQTAYLLSRVSVA
ncbi:NAD(P)-binding domain-containing protein [Agreia sp. PsM10]|uniref:flavin-containing monooxygenase n=1 Tax=Agreia sp. PsM10 TaxID=3030533 RepID=UPI00263AC182|nr:NAD(P)-binding domain-containing protein [Agreia sp. PsM10]MDN4641054.1 NAD(P)-binding domain-containing protein [Agreia sp. PsM10]